MISLIVTYFYLREIRVSNTAEDSNSNSDDLEAFPQTVSPIASSNSVDDTSRVRRWDDNIGVSRNQDKDEGDDGIEMSVVNFADDVEDQREDEDEDKRSMRTIALSSDNTPNTPTIHLMLVLVH